MYNRIVLVGRLTKDPELRHTQSGKAVAVCLWLSGEEYESETGAADRFEPISRGPDAFQRLVATVQSWEKEFPGAVVDSEIPLVVSPMRGGWEQARLPL